MLSFLFTIWAGASFCQNTCHFLEQRMQALLETKFSISEAEEILSDYEELECEDKLLAFNFIGFIHYNNSNFEKAKEYLLRGENDFFEKENNPKQFAINQIYTALILIVEKKFDSALYHLKKAETYAKQQNEKFIPATVYQNLGLVHVEMNKLEEAENYFTEAIGTGHLDSINIGYIYQNLAFLNLKKGNNKKTIEFIDRTKNIWTNLNFQKGIYLLSFIESKLAISQNRYSEALDYLQQGRSAYKVNQKLLLGENFLIEAQIQDSLGNTEAQLAALENAILESNDLTQDQLNTAIFSLSKIQNATKTNLVLAELITKLKTQNINQNKINIARNKIMDIESAEAQTIISNQLNYLSVLVAFLLFLSYILIRNKKQKDQIESLNVNLQSSKIKIEEQVAKLTQNNKELEQFAHLASHDLKSPLRNISTFAGLLKRKYNSNETQEFLDIIIKSSQNMSAMISDLLRFSTLDQTPNIENINFTLIIEHTLARINLQIKDANATIHIDESCDQIIQCDKSLFINVIQNLVVNSIIYCKEDELPVISISAFTTFKETTIKITDNGIGIDDSYKDQIFEMFRRLKTKDVDGTGIGLASCKKIIGHHNGSISVDSKLGEGSTFTIKLPFNPKKTSASKSKFKQKTLQPV